MHAVYSQITRRLRVYGLVVDREDPRRASLAVFRRRNLIAVLDHGVHATLVAYRINDAITNDSVRACVVCIGLHGTCSPVMFTDRQRERETTATTSIDTRCRRVHAVICGLRRRPVIKPMTPEINPPSRRKTFSPPTNGHSSSETHSPAFIGCNVFSSIRLTDIITSLPWFNYSINNTLKLTITQFNAQKFSV